MATYDSSGTVYVGVNTATAINIGLATKTTTFAAASSTIDFGSRPITGLVVSYPLTSGQLLYNTGTTMGGTNNLTYTTGTLTLAAPNIFTPTRSAANGTSSLASYGFASAPGRGFYATTATLPANTLVICSDGDRMMLYRNGAVSAGSALISVTLSNAQPMVSLRVHYIIIATNGTPTISNVVGFIQFSSACVTTGTATPISTISTSYDLTNSNTVAVTWNAVNTGSTVSLSVNTLTSSISGPIFTIYYSVDILSSTTPTITYKI
jgi:hypothetical protein